MVKYSPGVVISSDDCTAVQLSLVVSSHRPSPGLGIERRLVLSSAQNQLGHRAVVGEEREERMMVVTVEHYSGVRGRRGRRGGYLSVSWSLHCPGQTELAYSQSLCPPRLSEVR